MTERMLVIDDDPVVLESCRRVFAPEGYDVEVTTSPREGLDLADRNNYDVILCDWQMPEFDGMDVVEKLEGISPRSTVVMISGYPSVGRATDAMKRGAMDFVAKPFTPDEILAAVRNATHNKVLQERKTIGRFEGMLKSFQFPLPALEDKAPKTIAETVASTIGVGKTTSPWFSVLVLGLLAGAYIGFGGLLSASVTFDLAPRAGHRHPEAGRRRGLQPGADAGGHCRRRVVHRQQPDGLQRDVQGDHP
jgi:formate transporter